MIIRLWPSKVEWVIQYSYWHALVQTVREGELAFSTGQLKGRVCFHDWRASKAKEH